MDDATAFAHLVDLIEQTGLFSARGVKYGANPVTGDPTAEDYPRAEIYPDRFFNERCWEDGSVRKVDFRLVLTVRPEWTAGEPLEALQQLAQAVEAVVSRQPLGGCLPTLTELSGGSYDSVLTGMYRRGGQGERSVSCRGSFTYLN